MGKLRDFGEYLMLSSVAFFIGFVLIGIITGALL